LKELKIYIIEINKIEKLYKVDGITKEEQDEIDAFKRRIQKVTSMVVEKKQEVESKKTSKKPNKDDVKKY
jgi:hypothetical protein